jgi:hypothetical protein
MAPLQHNSTRGGIGIHKASDLRNWEQNSATQPQYSHQAHLLCNLMLNAYQAKIAQGIDEHSLFQFASFHATTSCYHCIWHHVRHLGLNNQHKIYSMGTYIKNKISHNQSMLSVLFCAYFSNLLWSNVSVVGQQWVWSPRMSVDSVASGESSSNLS